MTRRRLSSTLLIPGLVLCALPPCAAEPPPAADHPPVSQAEDGSVVLHARSADVHGTMLRYEPQPNKNTLGYWVRVDDWASWEFDVRRPGEFAVEALVGCGNGSGGAAVEFRVADKVLRLTVPVTGGFQNFQKQNLGRVSLDRPGPYHLEVRATSKPGHAVMDLREVKLLPVVKPGG